MSQVVDNTLAPLERAKFSRVTKATLNGHLEQRQENSLEDNIKVTILQHLKLFPLGGDFSKGVFGHTGVHHFQDEAQCTPLTTHLGRRRE